MTHRLLCLALLGALTLLSGCATLSEGQCRTLGWEQLGRMDGRQGYPASRLYKHNKACAEYGIAVDDRSYQQGREHGLLDYCTAANGFREGRKGASYHGVCHAKLEPAFLQRYRDGRLLHDAESDVNSTEEDIDRLERKLDDDDLDKKERRRLNRELRELFRDYRYQQRDLQRLERLIDQRYAAPLSLRRY